MPKSSEYLVTYDVACSKRWRRVFRLLNGYGDWVQLSVFRCRLDNRRRTLMERELRNVLDEREDRLLIAKLDNDVGKSRANRQARRAVVL